jgi:molecular chaperone GrpE
MTGEPPDSPEQEPQEDVDQQLRDLQDRYLRLRADFENYRRRAAEEQLGARRSAVADAAQRLLPVLDDAERALTHVPDGTDETWLRGLRLTEQKLRDALASLGVEPIEAVGARFDPHLHDAVAAVESDEQPENTVVDEQRPGYRVGDLVLRPSLVRVSRHPTPAAQPSETGGDGSG